MYLADCLQIFVFYVYFLGRKYYSSFRQTFHGRKGTETVNSPSLSTIVVERRAK